MIILGAFATYYVALSISQEDGPFNIFAMIRGWLTQGWIARGIRCLVCVSCYTGFLVAFVIVQPFEWRFFLVAWLGMAGASVTIDRWWKR